MTRTSIKVVFFTALAALSVFGQNAASISGQLLDRVTREPVPDAVVLLLSPEGTRLSRAVSDNDGAFTILGVQAGRYRVAAERQSYVLSEYGAKSAGKAGTVLNIPAGDARKGVVIEMTPTGAIAGQVLDAQGRPVVGARINAMRQVYDHGVPTLSNVTQVGAAFVTNDIGEYRVWGLAPGRYYMVATGFQAGWAPLEAAIDLKQGQDRYVPTLYPSATTQAEARAIEVKAGETAGGITIQLRNGTPGVLVRGRVSGDPGPEAARVNLSLTSLQPGPSSTSIRIIDELTKDFAKPGEARVAPGRYRATVSGNRAGGSILFKRTVIDIAPDSTTELSYQIEPPFSLRGTLSIESVANPALLPTRMQIRITPLGGPWRTYPDVSPATDGTFEVPRVMRDQFTVDVLGIPDGHYVASATMGDANVWDGGLDLTGDRGTLQLVIRDGAASVHGTLVDPKGAPSSGTVALIPIGADRRKQEHWYRTANAGADGEFTISSLAPAEYRLFAWESVDDTAWLNDEFLARYNDQAISLIAKPGSRSELRLTVATER